MMPRFLDMVDLDFFLVALRYTLMEQEMLESELPYCERADVGIVIGGVYNSGITATGAVAGAKYNYARRDAGGTWSACGGSRRCARRMACRSPRRRCNFPSRHPIVASVIPGAIASRAGPAERGEFPAADPGRPLVGSESARANFTEDTNISVVTRRPSGGIRGR